MDERARPGEIAIGPTLRDAREQAGITIEEAEQRTKIRARYLHALEAQRWDELPSNAYAKGFLRTYAGILGLDAERLVDEYRRQVEGGGSEQAYPLSERVLEGRKRPGGPPRRIPIAAIVLVVGVVAAVVVAFVVVSDDGDEPAAPVGANQEGAKAGGERDREHDEEEEGELVRIELRVRDAVEVCLLGAGSRELIDGQLLTAGTRDAFASERFQLRFPAGFDRREVRLEVQGNDEKLPAVDGPAAFVITPPDRVRQASPPKKGCP